MRDLQWLAELRDFREELRSALALGDSRERFGRLLEIAQSRLGYLETIRVDSAIRATGAAAQADLEQTRVALLSSCTVDHLLPPIRVAALRHHLSVDTYLAGFGQYRQEIVAPGSGLYEFSPQFVLLSLDHGVAASAVPVSATEEEMEDAVARIVDDLAGLWTVAKERTGAEIIQQNFLDVTEPLFGNHDRQVPGAPATVIRHVNDRLAQAAAAHNVLLLDIAHAAARDGLDAWFDVGRWLQGKMEISPLAAGAYGELVGRLIAARLGRSRKCLVLDLDNTLWGGVLGDDGLEGIVLGEGSAAGEAFLAVQRYAKALRERGILLAVCSKNDPAIVERVFREHPEMLLAQSDIASFAVSWRDKAEGLVEIANDLNIGLDSLVFVDDNPAERERIRRGLPAVAVPELPRDPAHFVRTVAEAGYFESVSYTPEDRQRADQYRANTKREALQRATQGLDEFLRDLQMHMSFGLIRTVDMPRATQLINKTNQFNTTTRRFTGEELARFIDEPTNLAFQFRLLDRFGDNGLVSVVLLAPAGEEPDILEIVNWVMSCRVFGRQLEDEIMNVLVEAVREGGARFLRAEYLATPRNGVISTLFDRLQFKLAEGAGQAPEASRWILDVGEYTHRATFISQVPQRAE